MAAKGDRAVLEPLAMRLYADGKNLTEIGQELDVSVTSLSKWKCESKRPDQKADDWDLARARKRTYAHRLRALFEREMEFVENQDAGSLGGQSADLLSKLGSLVSRFEDLERSGRTDVDRPAIFLQDLEWLAGKLKEIDPQGLAVLARNFDELIFAFKAEHAKAS